MDFIQVLQLKQRVLPFFLHPRPDGFNRIEIGRTRRKESRGGSIRFQKLLNLLAPMGPVIVHYYHFVKELLAALVSLVEVLDCLNVSRVGH